MAYYLVRAIAKRELLNELKKSLEQRAFEELHPFGRALSFGLCGARIAANGIALWEEEDYCSPPLAEERAAVLDKYFDNLQVEPVKLGEGWHRIQKLPFLFPDLNTESKTHANLKSSRKSARSRAAVIIFDDHKILLIYRFKNGREYYVLPGGGIEKNETSEEAALREIKEETGLDVTLAQKLWEFKNYGYLEHYFLASNFSGKLKFGGPELKKMSEENVYRLVWISFSKLNQINLLPVEIKNRILNLKPGIRNQSQGY